VSVIPGRLYTFVVFFFFGWFLGVWILYTDVSEHFISSS